MNIAKMGVLVLIAFGVLFGAGCSRVHEPWDNGDRYKQERTRSAEQEKSLRERALLGGAERRSGIQQVNRTS